MSAKQYSRGRRQRTQIVVVDGLQAHLLQSRYLLSVVNDITQATKSALAELLFGCVDGACYAKAETTVCIYINLHRWGGNYW